MGRKPIDPVERIKSFWFELNVANVDDGFLNGITPELSGNLLTLRKFSHVIATFMATDTTIVAEFEIVEGVETDSFLDLLGRLQDELEQWA